MNRTFESNSQYQFKRHPDWSVDLGIASGCIFGFVFAWIGLICYLFLEHWMAGLLGALAGGLIGWMWFKVQKIVGQQNSQQE